MIKVLSARIYIFSVLMFFSFNTMAVNCEEASPNLSTADGDMYFDVSGAEQLTKNQQNRIRRFLSIIDGRWQGRGIKSYCVENKKRNFVYEIKANVEQHSDGQLIFEFNSFDIASRSIRDERLRFLGSNNQYHITKLTEDTIGLYVKYRRPNANRKTTSLIEEIIEITGNKKSLKLSVTQYLNGYFAEEYERVLHR